MSTPAPANRALITIGLLTTMFMSALDTTVANIALPHIQGSLSASPEQITWVITSYLVATAVATPVSGWMVTRFGIRRMLLACVAAFTLTSGLCGISTNLSELVLLRALQGIAAAPLGPLGQSVLLNINPPERHGRAMASFTMAAVLSPAIGPIIGGWLTDALSWRWCFFINLPTGVLSMLLLSAVLPTDRPTPRRFDFLGFGSLAVAVSALQLLLDRGTTLDWFSSPEIRTEAAVAAAGFWMYLVHSATHPHPLFPPALLRDRNFASSMVFGFLFTVIAFTSFTLLPLMMQHLLGFPVLYTGAVSVPRGLVMLAVLMVMGRIDGIVDRRLLLGIGLFFFTLAFWQMSAFGLETSGRDIVWATLLQGLGQGIMFVPLATLGFATVPAALRPDASALSSLTRNLGSSIGVASMQALASFNAQQMHASLAEKVTALAVGGLTDPPALLSPTTPAGLALLDGLITRRALMVAYVDDFRLLAIICLCTIPMVMLMRTPRAR